MFPSVSHRRFAVPASLMKSRGVCDYNCSCGDGRLARPSGAEPRFHPKLYPTTSIPIDRAVPRTLLMAASTDAAFRSGIFCLAISSTCFSVTLPTLSLFGAPDPLAMPAARFSNTDAGGVLVINVNERSLYTVITTGTINPSSSFCEVRALNCLQNSMILTCACPSAGPTGGAGVALPAAICNFTEPVAFFARMPFPIYLKCRDGACHVSTRSLRDFFHLPKFQFHRSRSPEDGDHHFQSLAIFVHVVDHAGKSSERAFADANHLALFEFDLEFRLVPAVGHFINDVIDFFFRQRSRLLSGAHKSGNPRRRLHHVPDVIVHVHLHQHVAGIEHALRGVLLAATDFGDRLGRNQHLADFVLQPEGLHARFERFPHLALEARIGVDDVPLHIRIARGPAARNSFRRRRRQCLLAFLASRSAFVLFFIRH